MLCLYVQAPFGVFRTFTAGSFRPTASFITPTAAYGLLLNVAGIEMRREAGREMTLIKSGLPRFRLALGALELPSHHSIYQQCHNYPVGNTGKERAGETKGNKYNITPVRRSFLSNLKAYLCMDAESELETKVVHGLRGTRARAYGLPFLGDNNFLLDRIEVIGDRKPAYWFVRVTGDEAGGMRRGITRLTTYIDREDMSNTVSALFAPTSQAEGEIPDAAWLEVGY